MTDTIAYGRPRIIERSPHTGRVAAAWEPPRGDVAALEHALRGGIAGEVRFDAGSRALYSTDASNYRQVPIGVVIPRSIEDVVATVALCRRYGAPVLPRGGGTSLAGECSNVAVVIDFSKYLNRILAIDPARRLARVQPGVVLDDLRDAAEAHGLTFGPDPATHDHNTLGGMIGNNSCGVHSVMAGRTSDNVQSLDILTADGLRMTVGPTREAELAARAAVHGREGEIYRRLDVLRRRYAPLIRERFPKIPRRVSGYENLDQLFAENGCNVARALVGTEATCVTVLEATLNLVPSPRRRVLAILAFPDVFHAADAVPRVLEFGPIALEGMDDLLVAHIRKKRLHVEYLDLLPEGGGWLVAQFGGGSEEDAVAKAQELLRAFDGKLIRKTDEQAHLWTVRESGLGATAYVPGEPETWEGWEDSAVRREDLGRYLRDFKALLHEHGYEAAFYGHFGDGLVHCRINFELRSERGIAVWRRFLDAAADLVVRYGGSLSGEHGDGQSRAALLEKMYGPELMRAFREFKSIWDPEGLMNPGKVVDPFPPTSNLRLGPSYRPPEVTTHFSYPEDRGRFAHAAKRCVGVGACRRSRPDGGVMCPSYQATREEKHSTRGRARLLFEMLHGGPLQDGWRSREVEDALDLCLGCKGCKSDCPVNVDMATYKAEFRAHHYRNRLRPRAAYSMGLIWWWSRAASRVPRIANALAHAPIAARALKRLGGIAPDRDIPRYAPSSFVDWFRARPSARREGTPILLFPDTFNNYFRPQTAVAATLALERAGFRIIVPRRPLCCARPLYDWGMLDTAKRLLRDIVETLGPAAERGIPVLGLEPACTAAFREELPRLLAHDRRARRLAEQTVTLAELIEREPGRFATDALRRKALAQVHCHQHAIMKYKADRRVLERLGLDFEVLSSGCCGMAGAFGFEREKREVSRQIADQVLLPRVHAASPDTLLLADGFSCREQIEQATGRATTHLAEAVAAAMGVEADDAYTAVPPARAEDWVIAGTAVLGGMVIGSALGRALR